MKAFFARRLSSSTPHENHPNYEFEGDMSIDHHIKEEAKEFHNTLSRDLSGENTPSGKQQIQDILHKAKIFYTSSWNDVQSYVKSLTGTSLEDIDAQASTAEQITDDQGSLQSLDSKADAKRKWVVYDMVKLGFKDDQIKDSIGYIATLSEELTREEMLKRVVDYLVEQRRTYDHIIDIETDTQQMLPKPGRWGPPPPPGYKPGDYREQNETQEIRLISPEDSIKEIEKQPKTVEKIRYVDELENMPDAVECPICFKYSLKKDMKSLLNCSHEFCLSCYADYLNQQIDSNKVLRIGCPWEGCQEEFEEDSISKVVSKTQLEKYIRFKRVTVLNLNPNLRWCVRPGCDRYVIGKKGARKVVCECGMKMCFKCGSQYHFGKSCEAAIEKVYSKYAKEQNVQDCPQCHSRTEKSGGCHHITCTRCTYEWCWLCKLRYTPDHYSETNPNHCKKIEINADDGRQQEDYIRDTYCSRMLREPMLLIAFPLFLMIMSAMTPQWLITQYMRRKRGRDYEFALENGTGTMMFVALLGILLLPISMLFIFTTVMIDGIVDLYLWIYRKVKGRDVRRKPRMLQPDVV